jgi:PhzF family phenazine biosynthesis protein
MKAYFLDAFTNAPFKGNPAAVCLLVDEIEEASMLKLAKEIGFSETAYLKKTDKPSTYSIRYFSPKKEIPLCGHATLASAKVVFETTKSDDVVFVTYQGIELHAKKNTKGEIMMVFPVYDTTPIEVPTTMLRALGIEDVKQTAYSPQNKIIVLEIEDAKILAALEPDFNALLNSYEGINGVLVTAASHIPEYDFHYRYFWPWAGTNEDPVTGGVQTFLTKYWAHKLNKKTLKAFQASERTGFMTVELIEDTVHITGSAVILLEGEFKDFVTTTEYAA